MIRRPKTHPLEALGFGTAPFHVVGFIDRIHIARPGHPPVPAGVCEICRSPLRHCFVVASSDGRRFEVGGACIAGRWWEDSRLAGEALEARKAHRRAATTARRESTKAQEVERIAAALAALEADPTLLAGEPHPRRVFAKRGKTLRDYVVVTLELASHSTRFEAAKLVEKRLPRKSSEASQGDAPPTALAQ